MIGVGLSLALVWGCGGAPSTEVRGFDAIAVGDAGVMPTPAATSTTPRPAPVPVVDAGGAAPTTADAASALAVTPDAGDEAAAPVDDAAPLPALDAGAPARVQVSCATSSGTFRTGTAVVRGGNTAEPCYPSSSGGTECAQGIQYQGAAGMTTVYAKVEPRTIGPCASGSACIVYGPLWQTSGTCL